MAAGKFIHEVCSEYAWRFRGESQSLGQKCVASCTKPLNHVHSPPFLQDMRRQLSTKLLNCNNGLFQKVKIWHPHGRPLLTLDGFLEKISLFPDGLVIQY